MLQRCTADSCSVFPPGALSPFFAKLLSSQLVSRFFQMQDLILAFVEHHEVIYTIRYTQFCVYILHTQCVIANTVICLYVYPSGLQVYRHIFPVFLWTALWFPESNKPVKFLNFIYMQGDFSQNTSNDKPLCQVGFCFVTCSP